jgi:hypothetical protein
MELMKAHCIDGVILDYQQPGLGDPSRTAIDLAFPLVVEAVQAAGMEVAVMWDTSSFPGGDWGRDDPAAMMQYWTQIVDMARETEAYLRDSTGHLLFFGFGATPMPVDAVKDACPECRFYAQNSRADVGPTSDGGFAWVAPDARGGDNMLYLAKFYEYCLQKYTEATVPCVGAAWAGFKAVYPGHNVIERSSVLLRDTLQLCRDNGVEVCQVATWNDYNEGQHVQPSWWCDGNDDPEQFLKVILDFQINQQTPTASPTPLVSCDACEANGFGADQCGCGVCGSYGGCSFSCEVQPSAGRPACATGPGISSPTAPPSSVPSQSPSKQPSASPTAAPFTPVPTQTPTDAPVATPTPRTNVPSNGPTPPPTVTMVPSAMSLPTATVSIVIFLPVSEDGFQRDTGLQEQLRSDLGRVADVNSDDAVMLSAGPATAVVVAELGPGVLVEYEIKFFDNDDKFREAVSALLDSPSLDGVHGYCSVRACDGNVSVHGRVLQADVSSINNENDPEVESSDSGLTTLFNVLLGVMSAAGVVTVGGVALFLISRVAQGPLAGPKPDGATSVAASGYGSDQAPPFEFRNPTNAV